MAKVNSIKRKITGSFIAILFTVMVLLNVFLSIYVTKYYYNNMQEVISNQLQVSINFYNKYFSSETLLTLIYDNVDAFWEENNSQIQLLDPKGKLLMDSIGTKAEDISNTIDIQRAVNGEEGTWVGTVSYSNNNDKVMAVSKPIIDNNGEVVGIIRAITSLEGMDKTIRAITIFFFGISLVVIIIGSILSMVLSNSIILPIKSLTRVAEKMADGNFIIRSDIKENNEIGQLAKTFNYMADEIERREELKNDFISSISHELRTPLTAIKGWVLTLKEDYTDIETLDSGFDIIDKETERLSSMVEELLDFSRLVSYGITLNLVEHDMDLFVEYIKKYMEPRAQREGINYTVRKDENLGKLKVDSDRLKQVLINILDNSFKFTNTGGEVEFIVNRIPNNMEFIVKDTGCGISKNDLPKVKEKFYKGKNSKSKNGIGLSICDEIIKLHKGEFTIVSEVNVGTMVKVCIPIEGIGDNL